MAIVLCWAYTGDVFMELNEEQLLGEEVVEYGRVRVPVGYIYLQHRVVCL